MAKYKKLLDQFMEETKTYRCSYFEILIKKYVKFEDDSDEYDIRTGRILHNKYKLKKLKEGGFGSLTDYYCESSKATVNALKDHVIVQRKQTFRKHVTKELSQGEDNISALTEEDEISSDNENTSSGEEYSPSDNYKPSLRRKNKLSKSVKEKKKSLNEVKHQVLDKGRKPLSSDKYDKANFNTPDDEDLNTSQRSETSSEVSETAYKEERSLSSDEDEKQTEKHLADVKNCCVKLVRLDLNTKTYGNVLLPLKHCIPKVVTKSTSEKSENDLELPYSLCQNIKSRVDDIKELKCKMKPSKIIFEEKVIQINAILSPTNSPIKSYNKYSDLSNKINTFPCVPVLSNNPPKFNLNNIGVKTNSMDSKALLPFKTPSSFPLLPKYTQKTLQFQKTKSSKIKRKSCLIQCEEGDLVSIHKFSPKRAPREMKPLNNFSNAIRTLPCPTPQISGLSLKNNKLGANFGLKNLQVALWKR